MSNQTTTCSPAVAAVKPLLIVLEDAAPTLEAIAKAACLRVAAQEIVIDRMAYLLAKLLYDPTQDAKMEVVGLLEDLRP